MAKKKLSKAEHNAAVWAEVKELEDKIESLKDTLYPAELQQQASLLHCNQLAAKAKAKKAQVDPVKLAEEAPKAKSKR